MNEKQYSVKKVQEMFHLVPFLVEPNFRCVFSIVLILFLKIKLVNLPKFGHVCLCVALIDVVMLREQRIGCTGTCPLGKYLFSSFFLLELILPSFYT